MSDRSEKVKSLEELAKIVARARENDLRVAQCHGVFDLLHPGHIRHFEEARQQAELLVVTLTADDHVDRGPGRPIFNQRLRAESVAALQVVDYVVVLDSPTAVESIRTLRPAVFVKGNDYTNDHGKNVSDKIRMEEHAVEAIGGRIHFTNDISFSSTHILNSFFSVFSQEAAEYLRCIRRKYSSDQIIDLLNALKPLRVLVLGDIIIDEYTYCRAEGKSSKSATLTARFLSTERHAGGALAVANHVAGLADEVHLLSYIADAPEDETFVRDHMKTNVQIHLVPQPGRTTVVKRRYVEPFRVAKMFEVMWLDAAEPLPQSEDRLLEHLARLLPQCDLVIVADFGHGGVGQRTIEWLSKQSAFLAVNTQTNSANTGYNLIFKYPRADYICIDEEEVRLANHDRFGELDAIIAQTAQQMDCGLATVTRGSHGSITWTHDAVARTPVFSTEVIDSVGAGDAYLSTTALCAKMGYDADLIGFIGNCVGALAVRIVGNKQAIEPTQLYRYIETLLK